MSRTTKYRDSLAKDRRSFDHSMTSLTIDPNLNPHEVELSVVIPCLNEADTLADCIRTAQAAIRQNHLEGEVIVADNGSDDSSVEIATKLGARLVHVPAKGYGSALMGGIAAARGEFIIMGDADGSYDFLDPPIPGKVTRRVRPGPGMPAAVGGWQGHAWGDAGSAPLDRQPDLLAIGAAMVPCTDTGHLLRNAGF